MKKNLEDIRDKLENEVETAKALAEAMILIHAGSYSFDQYEVMFENVQHFFGLMVEISENHVRSLDILTDDLTDFHNDLKTN
ncbi:MAG: hypothetical protein K2N26_07010 [Oscillospiraceae bacterium]|nr:hypothetical protein [Oscillospiraceae bacterium]